MTSNIETRSSSKFDSDDDFSYESEISSESDLSIDADAEELLVAAIPLSIKRKTDASPLNDDDITESLSTLQVSPANDQKLSSNSVDMTIQHNGVAYARLSWSSLITHKWRKVYWVTTKTSLLVFSSKEHCDKWFELSRELDTFESSRELDVVHNQKEEDRRILDKMKKLLKLRIDFLHEMRSIQQLRGFKFQPIKTKYRIQKNQQVFSFKLERCADIGVQLIGAFASESLEQMKFLQHALQDILRTCPHGGYRYFRSP